MAKKVVIVESNAKAKTISRYLGKGYFVGLREYSGEYVHNPYLGIVARPR